MAKEKKDGNVLKEDVYLSDSSLSDNSHTCRRTLLAMERRTFGV
jgi:hypothetical protein